MRLIDKASQLVFTPPQGESFEGMIDFFNNYQCAQRALDAFMRGAITENDLECRLEHYGFSVDDLAAILDENLRREGF